MGEIKIGSSKVFLNSLVKNAEKYFSENTKPIDAEIIDAHFERNGEEEYVIDGLWTYYTKRRGTEPNTPEEKYIHHKYLQIFLYLQIREKESGKHSVIKLTNLDDMMAHLMENGREELREIEERIKNKNKDEYFKKLKSEELKEFIDEEKERILKLSESCLPLIKRPVNVYRQAINGQDVIGFSKVYMTNK